MLVLAFNLYIDLLNVLYAPLSILRASGRLIWPVYYIIIIFAIYKLFKSEQKNRFFFLIIFLLIQIFDFSNSFEYKFFKRKKSKRSKIETTQFGNSYQKTITNVSTTKISNRTDSFNLISNFLIDNNFESTNYFRLGRYNREFASEYRSKFIKKLMLKKIDLKKAFIIENKRSLKTYKIFI